MSGQPVPTHLPYDWFPEPLPPNVVIGEQSHLHSSYAFVRYRSERPCGLRVGHDTGVYVGTTFDLGPHGEVEVGDYCTLVGPIISTNGRVTIGDYVLISYEVVMADSFVAVPPGATGGASRPIPEAEIMIGDCAWIGTRAVLLPGARLGEGAIVGAGAVIDFEVPAYAIVAGNPARIVGRTAPMGRRRRTPEGAPVEE